MFGNYNFTDGMYINYDNSSMNSIYSNQMMGGMPGPAPGYMNMMRECPLMSSQRMSMVPSMQPVCPMMCAGMQYSPSMPVNNMYNGFSNMGNENYITGMNPGMVSMRAVSIKDIQD